MIDFPLLLPNDNKTYDLLFLIQKAFNDKNNDRNSVYEGCNKINKINTKHSKNVKFCILNQYIIFTLQRINKNFEYKK